MKRLYESYVANHIRQYEQMLFLAGPRQVGKTTIAKSCRDLVDKFVYLNWDVTADRQQILDGHVIAKHGLDQSVMGQQKSLIVFDELHKYPQWKNYLKGLFDTYKGQFHIMVTGSAKLNIYRKGNDSLMGRYFLCRVHPITVREVLGTQIEATDIQSPVDITAQTYQQLFEFGGFPEPFIKHQQAFSAQWLKTRNDQLFREDIRDLSNVQELALLEILAEVLKSLASKQLNLTKLGSRLQIAATTVKRWLEILSTFYYCFTLKPWSKSITRSLVKEPKIYLWDWAMVADPGARFENFVAAHLLKAVHYWTDQGLGHYEIYYLRDLDKREVDFIVTKDGEPWMLVEAKSSQQSLSPALAYFQQQTGAAYAFQVTHNMAYVDEDCFAHHKPIIVPAMTFLSQLV